jgi:hypothetical protein
MNRQDESINDRNFRYSLHQAMLDNHRERKALARERHRNRWHKFKIIPIILI